MAMARSDETTPLLLDIDSTDTYDLKQLPDTLSVRVDRASDEKIQEKDLKIVAVFVVTFDTRHGVFRQGYKRLTRVNVCYTGNTIEWSCPKNVDLDGVEFKSMASGLHNVLKDFM